MELCVATTHRPFFTGYYETQANKLRVAAKEFSGMMDDVDRPNLRSRQVYD